MDELRIATNRDLPQGPPPASGDRHGAPHRQPQQHGSDGQRQPPGAEELAVALHGSGHAAFVAHFEVTGAGDPLVRIVDQVTGETVALLTPEELRTMAEQTGLPSGLLLRVAS